MPRRSWWALGFLVCANLVVFAGVTIMNVALPAVQEDLSVPDEALGWVVTLYSLIFGALILVAGHVADSIGLRRMMTIGLALFAGASLLGGIASDVDMLLSARDLQGAGGAMVAATVLGLMSSVFPDGPERARAFAVLGIVMGLSTGGSFLVAGFFVDALSWRWCMLAAIPIALASAGGILRTVRRDERAARRAQFDGVGAVLITGAVALLVVGVDRAGAGGVTAPRTWGLLAAAALAMAAFVMWLRRAAHPLVPIALVADVERRAAFIASLAVGVGTFPGMYVLTTFLDQVNGYSAVMIGVAFLPFGVTATLASLVLTRWADQLRPLPTLAVGLVLVAAANLSFVVLGRGSTATAVLPPVLLLGAGATVVLLTGANLATRDAGSDGGIAGSMVTSAQQLGAALGTALLGGMVTWGSVRSGGSMEPGGYGAAGVLAAVLILVAVPLVGRRRSNTPVAENVVH